MPAMTDRPSPPREPTRTPKAQAEQEARRVREAAALRANLLKRKQQARARSEPDEPVKG